MNKYRIFMKDYTEKFIECEHYDLDDGEFNFIKDEKIIYFIFAEYVISIELIPPIA